MSFRLLFQNTRTRLAAAGQEAQSGGYRKRTRHRDRLRLEQLEDRTVPSRFQGLGGLPGTDYSYSDAKGVSADGSVVVGTSTSSSGSEAFRWTANGGMIGLGDLAGGAFDSHATGVSADGSVVVGYSNSPISPNEAFRWTGGGMVGLGDLTTEGGFSQAEGVSADGSVVVGFAYAASGYEAFRWTAGVGMVGLTNLPGDDSGGAAYGVSADGSVVVGNAGSASTAAAFRWTGGGGMVNLGSLTYPRGVSADGSVVVGGTGPSPGSAFIWEQTHGTRSLRGVLVNDYGVSAALNGWILSFASAISADGSTVVGQGINPTGKNEAWIARIGTTPVIVVLTHGWNPTGTLDTNLDSPGWTAFRSNWDQLAVTFENMPYPNTLYSGKVGSYVSKWDSSSGFTLAIAGFVAKKVIEQTDAYRNAGTTPGEIEVHLEALEAWGVFDSWLQSGIPTSQTKAKQAAQKIVRDLVGGYLDSDPKKSTAKQKIIIVGHSRGAAVNALVSKELSDKKYKNIVDFVSLDGYSTDWLGGFGALGDASINDLAVANASPKNDKWNYLVENGLSAAIRDDIEALRANYPVLGSAPAELTTWINTTFGDPKAPYRPNFNHNDIIHDSFTNVPTDHTNITSAYLNSYNASKPYDYMRQNFLGDHWKDPAPTGASPLRRGNSAFGSRHNEPPIPTRIQFSDGDFSGAAQLLESATSAGVQEFLAPLFEGFFATFAGQVIGDTRAVLDGTWDTTGDVALDPASGAVRLVQTDDTSLGQLVYVRSSATSLDFDLTVEQANADDTVQVLANGTVTLSIQRHPTRLRRTQVSVAEPSDSRRSAR